MTQDITTFMKQLSFGAIEIDKVINQSNNNVTLFQITTDKKSVLARYYTGLHCCKISFKNKCGVLIRIFMLTHKNSKQPKNTSSCIFSPDQILQRYYLERIFQLTNIKIFLSVNKEDIKNDTPTLKNIVMEMEDFFGHRQNLLDLTCLLIKDQYIQDIPQDTQNWMEISKNCCTFIQQLLDNNRKILVKNCPSWELKHATLIRQLLKNQGSSSLKSPPCIQLTKQSLDKLDECNNYYLKELEETGQALFSLIKTIEKRNEETQQKLLEQLIKIGRKSENRPQLAIKFMDYLLLYFNVPPNWKSEFYIIVGELNILSKISCKYAWRQQHSKMLHIDQYLSMFKDFNFSALNSQQIEDKSKLVINCEQISDRSRSGNLWQSFQNCLINWLQRI